MDDNHAHPAPPLVTVDARGLACPLPVLKLRKALTRQLSGGVVELLATDRTALRDVPAFCTGAGYVLLTSAQDGPVLRFTVRKS